MKLLVPLDQSPRDRIALTHGIEIAKAQAASMVFAHVVALPRSFSPETLREAKDYLAGVKVGLRGEDLEADYVVRHGDPATEIVRLAEQLEVDMIVMATRGRRSVAEAVLAASQQPVVLLNENTTRDHLDGRVRLQSHYVAGVVWNKQAAGEWTEDQAVAALESIALTGLDRALLFSSYRALARDGVATAWLDLRFQVQTLRQYLPDEIAGSELDLAA